MQLFFVYYQPKFLKVLLLPQPDVAYNELSAFFLIRIYSMQGWTATMRQEKEAHKD